MGKRAPDRGFRYPPTGGLRRCEFSCNHFGKLIGGGRGMVVMKIRWDEIEGDDSLSNSVPSQSPVRRKFVAPRTTVTRVARRSRPVTITWFNHILANLSSFRQQQHQHHHLLLLLLFGSHVHPSVLAYTRSHSGISSLRRRSRGFVQGFRT